MTRSVFWACCGIFLALPASGSTAVPGFTIGVLQPGQLDLITDVPGVRVGNATRIEGAAGPLRPGIGPVRTGVTVVLPNDDPWMKRVSAAFFELNGNGEMTGTHWIDEGGFLSSPIALTNTLDVGRVDDGVIAWMIRQHPEIGVSDDVPLPVVAECDDQALNDIQGRHVSAEDTIAALVAAKPGPFPRGNVGAGTGMRAFDFKAGIGSASRRSPSGKYVVGALVNANTGDRRSLRINGYPVGAALANEYLPVVPRQTGYAYKTSGRAADGSIIIVVATDAPLDSRQLTALGKRAALGLGRTGATSHLSSGDLIVAFSTTRLVLNRPDASGANQTPQPLLNQDTLNDEDEIDGIYAATAEATEAAVDDALFSARSMSGAHGITFFALPAERVKALLARRQ
jgi:D-aminopeptidase